MKRITALFLSLCLVATMMTALPVTASADISYGNYTYTVSGGEVTITDFDTSISGAITIPEEIEGYPVTGIGDWAFANCSRLTDITILDSVTSIGAFAFYCCSSLTSITVDSRNPAYSSIDGNLFDKNQTTLIQYAIGKTDASYEVPDSVTGIEVSAFEGCSSLTDITIPNGVTSIGDFAFCCCSSLTDITIPDGVTSIGKGTFSDCSSLTEITIPDSVTSIGDSAFSWCSSITDITIPDGITGIGAHAFSYCDSLTGIIIPDGVTRIGEWAFEGCSSLTEITIPDSVTTIGERAFFGCSSLTGITIPGGVTGIGAYAFYDCSSLTDISIPDCVASISAGVFSGCSSLTGITIPDSVTDIGWCAFLDCNSLTDVYYTGSEADWDKISVNDYNESLTNATIHYNFVVEEPALSIGFDKNSNQITVTATEAVSGANLLVARYQDGKMVGIEPVSISILTGENTIESPMSDYSGADTVKFLIWESLTSAEPLCASFTDSL